jgi:hypothetical protein
MAYRNLSHGTQDNRTFNRYGYEFLLDNTKTLKSVTFPNNRNLVILAITPFALPLERARLRVAEGFFGRVLVPAWRPYVASDGNRTTKVSKTLTCRN